MTVQEKAHQRREAILKDILENHLPRVVDGLRKGYIDENQILVIYDHAVRARIIEETLDTSIVDAVFTPLEGTPQ